MTTDEKEACDELLLHAADDAAQPPVNEAELSYLELYELLESKKSRQMENYGNCNFILGSAAEVERLWSIAANILSDHRKKTTPVTVCLRPFST